MTTVLPIEDKCIMCGTISQHMTVGSTNTFGGSCDLDTRPPEMMRSTIKYWIRRCPGCGYCAPVLAEGMDHFGSLLKSAAYCEQLADKRFPVEAASFLCWVMFLESVNEYARAGWEAMHAAWICDDELLIPLDPVSRDSIQQAMISSRRKAIELFEEADAAGQEFMVQSGGNEALLSDINRRIGEFQMTSLLTEVALNKKPEQFIKRILLFERYLAEGEDDTCHTVEEAVSFVENGGISRLLLE